MRQKMEIEEAAHRAYREDYFLRLRGRAVLVEGVAPLALLLVWCMNSYVTDTTLTAYHRLPIWAAGSVSSIALILAMRRVSSLDLHGWLTLLLLGITSLSLVFLATPTHEGTIWALPAILIVPIVAAPFWAGMRKNLLACVLSYGIGALLLPRIGGDAAAAMGYLILAGICTLLCIVSFLTIDRTRRAAYEYQIVLDHHAHYDSLTGLPSRRKFLEHGQNAVAASHANRTALSVSFVDLDHFKSVNDLHSHAAGDHALAIVAQIMSLRMKRDMVAARIGGEEFVLLLPGFDAGNASLFVDDMRKEISRKDMGGFTVTISAGVAELNPGMDLSRVMELADQALLEAKRSGRDKVVSQSAR